MGFDRRAAVRRLKPQRGARRLARRSDAELPFLTGNAAAGHELLLDTTVYIDLLKNKTSIALDQILETRTQNHSSIALSELTHLIGALDPAHPGTADVLRQLGQTIDDMQQHRLTRPSVRAFGEAGMLAGVVTRLAGRPNGVALLNDAALFLHAAEMGFDLLTGNIQDFDYFDQLVPGTGLLFYR